MLGISVELGTYSLKFLNYQIDKKSISLINTDEIIVDNPGEDQSSLWKEQIGLVKEYLSEIEDDYQLLMHMPSDIVSTRFIDLPVKSKKKAALMLPFQIEEDLPYSLTNCHWSESMHLHNDGTEATVGIIRKEHFSEFYNFLKDGEIHPAVLTSDVSSLSSFVRKHIDQFPQSFCVINIGHATTRGFYFKNGKLIANHHSYVAGEALTEAISKTYSITTDEATIYKHQNSYLLLEEQYDQVNENQREFAKVMDATLAPLLSEIKRWDIGYRVQHGEPIKSVYICGGSSNIKNIQNYLSTKLSVEIQFFNPFQFIDSSKIDQDEKLRRKFSQLATLSSNTNSKSGLINFLKGDFALNSTNDLPIESMVFIGMRLSIISFIICLSLIIKTLIVSGQVKDAKKFASRLYKDDVLKTTLSASIKRRAKKNPSLILNKLSQQEKMIKQEVNVIQSSLKTNAFHNVNEILAIISGYDVEIIKLVSTNDQNIDLVLSSKTEKELASINQLLSKDKNRKWFLDFNKKKLTLSIGGKGKEK
jgi:Tfp pilus assembly PilM family ATPase